MGTKSAAQKVPVIRVPSDDCMVNVGRVVEDGTIKEEGAGYAVHKGEYVEVMPVMSMRESLVLARLSRTVVDGELDADMLDAALTALCVELARRVRAWDWTDNDGVALTQPHNDPDVIEALSTDEVLWLVTAAQGETQEARKNGSSPLGSSSTTRTA